MANVVARQRHRQVGRGKLFGKCLALRLLFTEALNAKTPTDDPLMTQLKDWQPQRIEAFQVISFIA